VWRVCLRVFFVVYGVVSLTDSETCELRPFTSFSFFEHREGKEKWGWLGLF
jgi:hypothetical protein